MLCHSIVSYFKQQATASGFIAPASIYPTQAPMDTDSSKMPWIVVEVASGSRNKIAQNLIEENAQVRISVDTGPSQVARGAAIVETCQRLLENYRGYLYNLNDVVITCGAIRDWAGIGGAYRYQFDALIRYTVPFNQPTG